MPVQSRVRFALVLAVSLLLGAPAVVGAEQAQPGADVLRVVDGNGDPVSYAAWISWAPSIVSTPDGGAWAFFSAEPKHSRSAKKKGRLYAARFDPATALWHPAHPMPGGDIQMGPAAVVDGQGTVHLIYTDRATEDAHAFATLVYTRWDDNGGWATPVPVAAAPTAGHQVSGSLAIDGSGRIHVMWQDQRGVPPEDRAKSAANADIFSSTLVNGGWTKPTQVNRLLGPGLHATQPHVAVDGDRVVAIWSIYRGTSREELKSAVRVEWSTRLLDPTQAWSEPRPLIERGGGDIGGRLVDLAADPRGGLAVAFGRRGADRNDLFLRRLSPGSETWDPEILLASGSRASYPSLAFAPDGTTYVVYNVAVTADPTNPVAVGAVALPPGAETPGEETILTAGEDGAEGWAVATTDVRGRLWIIYFHQPAGSHVSEEVRCLRGAAMESPG